ncbi:pilus assembly protein [Aliiroseovarius sp. KMU-50]|uniref:Pilus assembly protein n=1 Tax=Aliiroseovarius salicola TaxID=3009082 RepID=A0ABT4VXW6_9RHOB|nr:TadE family protein [Aliiroseovarius sp. KMU-50]MDA5093101.1 pilus assembly protein [Aliiroseovarius sp. KMU-50]
MLDKRQNLGRCEKGSIFVESLLVLPLITLLSVGILEFGNVLWQRHQVQTGVRDAARYWARCKPNVVGYTSNCSMTKARNIAFYGNPQGTGALRVPNWQSDSQLTILPAKTDLPPSPNNGDKVYAKAELDYAGSPLFALLRINTVRIEYAHYQRYLGW